MASIVDDLLDFFPDTLKAQPGTLDGRGDFTPVGDPLHMPCHFEGRTRLVRASNGREVVSSLQAFVGVTAALINKWIATGWMGWIDEDWIAGSGTFPSILTPHGYRFTLPVRFEPRVDLVALSIDHLADEDGAHHEVVFFP